MMNRYLLPTIIVLAATLFAGCQGMHWQGSSYLDQNWGRSYESAKSQQILNPEAAENLKPVDGLNGPASENAMFQYQESFSQEPTRQGYDVNIIDIGLTKGK